MTEDMLEEHANVLVNLGNDNEAALLRAKIQSASLLSDMESFKAANIGCILEDFVRWYSPRDWIETETLSTETNEIVKTFELSHRMKIPGNMWVDVWNNAKALPVRKQKRLFDDTKEAEKVLVLIYTLYMKTRWKMMNDGKNRSIFLVIFLY
jgi:Rab3 GTPase-activating protein catalytic subunit